VNFGKGVADSLLVDSELELDDSLDHDEDELGDE